MRGNTIPALKEHPKRRKKLMDHMGGDSIAVLPAATPKLRNRDVHYPYRPSSDFVYLTGFTEANAALVLAPGSDLGEFLLFCEPRSPKVELWEGPRAGTEGAKRDYGADAAFPMSELDRVLPELLKNKDRLYYDMGEHAAFDVNMTGWMSRLRGGQRDGVRSPSEVISLSYVLHEMRLFKSRHEMLQMRKAAKISAAAINRAMRYCKPGLSEHQLEAEILHEYNRNGARTPAYPSIVGSGPNSCILHYTENCAPLQDKHLVLIDAGAELNYYASDITRTFPANGAFSAEQRAVYEVVLAAQKAAIAEAKVGNHWNDPHQAACMTITEGLVELGILKGDPDTLCQRQAYKPYYMHRTGHWIGMDVHDVGEYQVDNTWRALEPGMVMTVEPGLYLRPECPGLAARWHNIGIRIEDDVAVTRNGPEILSIDAAKEIGDIERLMAEPARIYV